MAKKCSYCNKDISNNYCENCGQRLRGKEITILSLFSEFFLNNFYFHKSGFYALYTMIVNPKKIIHNYWNGYSRYYPSPFQFIIYALFVQAIWLYLCGKTFSLVQVNITIQETYIGDYNRYLFWVIFPLIMSTISAIAFFRKKISFTKHLVSIIYLLATWYTFFGVINILICKIFTEINIINYYGLISLIYIFVVFFWNTIVHSNGIKDFIYNMLSSLFVALCVVILLKLLTFIT